MKTLFAISIVPATWALLAVYLVVVFFLIRKGANATKKLSDYALGTRTFSPAMVGLSLAASITSAATFIINPGLIGTYGISGFISYGLVLPFAATVSLVVLTKRFRKYGASVSAVSLAQWIGKRYDSSGFALFFGFLSLLLITFMVLICVGISQVLSAALDANPVWVLVAVVAIIFSYMMFGGANAMVYTNTIQAIAMLIVALILIGSGAHFFQDGIDGFFQKLSDINPMLAKPLNPNSFLFRDYFEIIFCQIVVGIAIVCQPHILTKSLLLKKEKDVNRYLTTGVIVQALFFLVVITGLYARLTFPDMKLNGETIAPDALISTYVVERFPVYISLLLIFGLISAGMSTLEGLIQSLSTSITSDILKPFLGAKKWEALEAKGNDIVVNKIVIAVLGLLTFGFSYGQLVAPDMSVAIFAQNGVYAFFSAAFIPVLFGMFFKEVPKASPILASITAVCVHFGVYYISSISYYENVPVRNPAIASALAIVSATVVGILSFLILKKRVHANRLVHKME